MIDGKRITITHQTNLGRADDWHASVPESPRWGIGKTWGEALESLVRANLDLFGIVELRIVDPHEQRDELKETVWRAKDTSDATPNP